jgi:hypothetical protein
MLQNHHTADTDPDTDPQEDRPMNSMTKLALVLALVATASLASLVTLLVAPNPMVQAQGLVTTRAPEKATAVAAGNWTISSYGYAEPRKSKRDDPLWTLGFFAINNTSGKVTNCIYMWSGSSMNKCVEYGWVKLPD